MSTETEEEVSIGEEEEYEDIDESEERSEDNEEYEESFIDDGSLISDGNERKEVKEIGNNKQSSGSNVENKEEIKEEEKKEWGDPAYQESDYILRKDGNVWQMHFMMKKKVDASKEKEKFDRLSDKSEVSDNKYHQIKNCSKSIGMVIFMDETYYKKTKEDNLKIHFPEADPPKIYPEFIKLIIEGNLNAKVLQVIVGHEHGTENGKCHLQIYISFESLLYKTFYPGKIFFYKNGTRIGKFIYMQQLGRNSKALANYCKKEKNFCMLHEEKKIKEKVDKNKDLDVFATIVENKDKMTREEAHEYLQRKLPREYFLNYSNITKTINDLIEEPLPEFRWILPKHLDNFDVPFGNMRVSFMKIFMEWFNENCKIENPEKRKVALCLYSEKKGLGKTCFVRSLVPDRRYILEYNNTFTDIVNKNQVKLLLLDDMKDIDEKNEQLWVSLVAGQRTTIRAPWVNKVYELGLPCIICTNSKKMVNRFVKDRLFYNGVITIEIDKYMGPPGTYNEDLYKRRVFLSEKTKNTLLDLEKEREENDKINSNISKILFKTYKMNDNY